MPAKKQKTWITPKLIRLLRSFGQGEGRVLAICKGSVTMFVGGPQLGAGQCNAQSEHGFCPSWVCMEMTAS